MARNGLDYDVIYTRRGKRLQLHLPYAMKTEIFAGKMRLVLLSLFICSFIERSPAENSSSILPRLPNILQHLCPGANVCRENQAIQAPLKVFPPGFDSCCTDCSCSSDCEENGNCCFPTEQPFTKGDQHYSDVLQNGRVCIIPKVQLQENEKSLYQSYYMVSSVSRDTMSLYNSSCGNTKVAPWGSLYPVYSAQTRQLYKNMACATANGVTDGKKLDVLLTSLTYFDLQLTINSFKSSDARFGQEPNLSAAQYPVQFIWLGNKKALLPLRCYRDVIDSCPDSELFEIPDETGFSKKEVIEACTSGLVSPYLVNNVYANVFCYICNTHVFVKEMYCKGILDLSSSRISYGFTGILDGSFVSEDDPENPENPEKKSQTPVACRAGNKENCRLVHCPSGQLYNRIGKCRYPIRIWFDQEFQIIINLTAKETINVTEVFPWYTSQFDALKSPWPRSWQILVLFYQEMKAFDKTMHFIVVLRNRLPSVSPQYLIQTVKQMVNREWVLQVNKTEHILKSEFSTTTNFVSRYDQMVTGNHTEAISFPRYRLIQNAVRFRIKSSHHVINRLNFCEQVELLKTEFILSTNKLILFNIFTQRYLYNGEFTLISTTEIEDFRARVCIEDSGFYDVSLGVASYGSVLLDIYCIVILFTE